MTPRSAPASLGAMLDEVAGYNRDRWQALVEAGVSFSRPWLELDTETARARLDQEGHLGEVAGQDVLCLAGGGGQQSAAFALLGARVSVLDLCEGQLDRDREALAHHGLKARLVAGDMRVVLLIGLPLPVQRADGRRLRLRARPA